MRKLAVLAILVAALVVGCGDDKGGGGKGGATAPGTGIVGTWVYDRGTPTTDDAGMAFDLTKMLKMNIEYTFAAGGTFTLKEQIGGGETSTITGAWELRDGKYEVTEKEKNGTPRTASDKQNTVRMELKDGDLSFNPEGAPVVFHLKRK
jgi:hypothetical protein